MKKREIIDFETGELRLCSPRINSFLSVLSRFLHYYVAFDILGPDPGRVKVELNPNFEKIQEKGKLFALNIPIIQEVNYTNSDNFE